MNIGQTNRIESNRIVWVLQIWEEYRNLKKLREAGWMMFRASKVDKLQQWLHFFSIREYKWKLGKRSKRGKEGFRDFAVKENR